MEPGDEVIVVNTELIDWETQNWLKEAYEEADLSYPDGIAIVDNIIEVDDSKAIVIYGSTILVHSDHFKKYESTK